MKKVIKQYVTDAKLEELIERCWQKFQALSPEQQKEHRRAQRISWVTGNLALDTDTDVEIIRQRVEEAEKERS